MFGSFLGRPGSGGTKGNKNSLLNWDPAIFDDKDAAGDSTNQLLPQQPGVVITQPQAAAIPAVPPGGGGGGSAGGGGPYGRT